MCAIDDCEPWTVVHRTRPKARKEYPCVECGRAIHVGETYAKCVGLCEGYWSTSRTCTHCQALSAFMSEMCGGYPIEHLLEELLEHWLEGYASIPLGRLIACMKLRWHDGTDPIPTQAGAIAREMFGKTVA